ncbi:DUF3316 domain-containing protein [Arenibacter sp. S6351L]|uniref:DUF3316 domain-containing protein n=1 Tax=Arenibacter sp. S6351L TaxID=2926407 RepID=UPI001FF45EB0|nr:DUF3316 domain-containing protein [Arenibacter sp. S6351L]MCK0135692.1 DUF3316 domain-containing protein [Arenibacter sp. S6351L]
MKHTKTPYFGLLLTAFLFIFSTNAFAQSSKTIKGEVLDMSCYVTQDAIGQGHKKCAQACLDKGLPAGILGEDGNVYLLVEDHSAADAYKEVIAHAAEKVEVTGKVIDKNGVKSLVVEKVTVKG